MSKSRLHDFRVELVYARKMKDKGILVVPADVAGEQLANGRKEVPIDEYINRWEAGITAMENGANQELYNY